MAEGVRTLNQNGKLSPVLCGNEFGNARGDTRELSRNADRGERPKHEKYVKVWRKRSGKGERGVGPGR